MNSPLPIPQHSTFAPAIPGPFMSGSMVGDLNYEKVLLLETNELECGESASTAAECCGICSSLSKS